MQPKSEKMNTHTEFVATAQRGEEENLHFQRRSPDVHRTIDHEGAVRHEQHRSAFKAGMQDKVKQELYAPLHSLTAAELFAYILRGVVSDSEGVGCVQLPCFAPLLLMHKALPVEGQFLL